jgi:hypothetical protein
MKTIDMAIAEMQKRFKAYTQESTRFIFGDWLNMDWAARNARQAEIDAKHNYKHGWIIVDGHSFDRRAAFPDEQFLNVWD